MLLHEALSNLPHNHRHIAISLDLLSPYLPFIYKGTLFPRPPPPQPFSQHHLPPTP